MTPPSYTASADAFVRLSFRPDEGDVRFAGRSIAGLAPEQTCAAGIARTFQLVRPFKELSPVEIAILLLGTHELASHLEIPYRAVINEAVELAKTYGGTHGHKYVNGVLDKLAVKLRTTEVHARA